jgi:hypothetical protein
LHGKFSGVNVYLTGLEERPDACGLRPGGLSWSCTLMKDGLNSIELEGPLVDGLAEAAKSRAKPAARRGRPILEDEPEDPDGLGDDLSFE